MRLPSMVDLDAVAIEVLQVLDSCDPWLVGGAVRDLLCGRVSARDLDVVVPDSRYLRAVSIAELNYGPAVLNRHGNQRYLCTDGLKLDLWSPRRFFGGYANVPAMLENVDYTCNAVALSRSSGFVASLSAVCDIEARVLRPIEARWISQSAIEYAHLVGRGVNFVRKLGLRPVNSQLFCLALEQMDEAVLRGRYDLEPVVANQFLGNRKG